MGLNLIDDDKITNFAFLQSGNHAKLIQCHYSPGTAYHNPATGPTAYCQPGKYYYNL